MEQLTIKQLYELCRMEIATGNGNKHIVISDDSEGNGYQGLFYGFSPCDEYFAEQISDSNYYSEKDTIILG